MPPHWQWTFIPPNFKSLEFPQFQDWQRCSHETIIWSYTSLNEYYINMPSFLFIYISTFWSVLDRKTWTRHKAMQSQRCFVYLNKSWRSTIKASILSDKRCLWSGGQPAINKHFDTERGHLEFKNRIFIKYCCRQQGKGADPRGLSYAHSWLNTVSWKTANVPRDTEYFPCVHFDSLHSGFCAGCSVWTSRNLHLQKAKPWRFPSTEKEKTALMILC